LTGKSCLFQARGIFQDLEQLWIGYQRSRADRDGYIGAAINGNLSNTFPGNYAGEP